MTNLLNRFQQLVKAAKERIQETSIASVKAQIDRSADMLLIDVRERKEWDEGHIPSAVHLSKGLLEANINALASEAETPIVLYCGGGSRSALAADSLERMGYTRVLSMAGGFRAWKASHYPIATD